MKNRVIHLFIFFVIACSMAVGQYYDGNRVVTISKTYLKPMSTVENGTSEERSKLILENRKKLDFKDKNLISSKILYHFWSGRSDEVIDISEFKSMAESDESTKTRGDRRKKAWPNEEKRNEFVKNLNKYWVGKHTDVGIYELYTKMLKERKKIFKENTYVLIQEFTLAPMSTIEGGSGDDRDEVMQKWFDNIIMKDDRILSQMLLGHYWTGSAGGPDGWPMLIVSEYGTLEDLLDEDKEKRDKLYEKGWPDEKEREEFKKKHRAYWNNYIHEDIGIYYNSVKQQKNSQ